MTEPLTDPREIRKLLKRAQYRGDRIDGKYGPPSTPAGLTGHVLNAAEHQGYSGEDAMTLLAYHALLNYERTTDMLLSDLACSIRPQVMVNLQDGAVTPLDSAVRRRTLEEAAQRCEQVAAHDTHMTAKEIALYLAAAIRSLAKEPA